MKTKLILSKSAFSFGVSQSAFAASQSAALCFAKALRGGESARRRSGGPGRVNAEQLTASRAPLSVAKLAFLCLLAACCLVIPAHAGIVTSAADGDSPGTLRSVMAAAAAGDIITFDSSLTGQTITLTGGQLTIDKDLTIAGPGAAQLAVNGNAASRVFSITPGKTVTIAGLTITNGSVSGVDIGGGIYNDHATLTVSNCTLSANSAGNDGYGGGGIFNNGSSGSASLTVVNSTLSGNSAPDGGGIFNHGSYGTATLMVANSTFSGNSADFWGGGIFNNGSLGTATLRLANSTFKDNSAINGGGIVNNGSATLEIGSTILNAGANGVNIRNESGSVTSAGYNLSSDGGGGFLSQDTDQINTDPKLGPLQDNGGQTPTHALLCGSPAIDHGTNFVGSTTDQRGAARTYDFAGIANASGGDGTDIGAVEAPIWVFNVENALDSGPGSLRAAISNANASAGIDFIEFAPSAYGNITLNNGQLAVTDCLFIYGPGPTNLAVNGNAASRVFRIGPGITVTIAGLTITNGSVYPDYGGGIYNDRAILTVSNCTLSANSAGGGGGIMNDARSGSASLTVANSTLSGNGGGGIFNNGWSGSASLTVANSTLSGNSAGSFGGGIFNHATFDGSATLTLANSTLSGNSAGNNGGGIYNIATAGGSATLTLANSTLSSNRAGFGGGGGIFNNGINGSATLTLVNSTLSGNSAGNNGGGIYNLATAGGSARLTLANSTLSGNSAARTPSGGIFNGGSATLEIGSTILNAGANLVNIFNNGGVVSSHGFNLSSDGGGGFLSQKTDQINTDPKLGPLQFNGGQTPSHALLCGSPAIDRGTNFFALATDQLGDGFARTVDVTGVANIGDGTDIGAFELQTSIDDTPPEITCPGPITWNTDPGACTASVTFAASASDNCSATIDYDIAGSPISSPWPFPLGTTTVHAVAADPSGNSTDCSFSVTVTDNQPPTISCPADVTVITTSASGMKVNYPAATATDNCSTPTITYSKDRVSSFGLGTTMVTATATDDSGNSAPCSFKVNVVYSWSGVLQPINADPLSLFKLGTTVQVKFQLTGASAGIANAVAKLSYTKLPISIPPGPVNEATSTAAATSGNLFRYDAKTKQYIFNWGTKGLTAGTYELKIDLGDGVSRTVNVGLK